MSLLGPGEIEHLEREHSGGVTARFVVQLFSGRGTRLSEATFRKYVQAGLLPRSRRVGRKGKHRGSEGLYPVEVIRRINAIKKMMDEGQTLEDIRRSFVFLKHHIDEVERALGGLMEGFESQLGEAGSPKLQQVLRAQLSKLRRRGEELVRDVTRLGSRVTARPREGVQSYSHLGAVG